jgi:cytochrome bd ubiquinol oxidase subunit II
MFGSWSMLTLQQYWWLIVSLLGSLLVFLLFVQGGQTLIYTLGKNEQERSLIINTLGRKWEFTFTTLVTFGGAFFASFPLFYATSFGGAYWLWMLILFCFIIQAIAYEYRSKPSNVFGHRTFEIFLFINGIFGSFFLGVAVATFFTGANFTVNDFHQSSWSNSFHGLEALINPTNVLLGLAVVFLSRVLALLYFIRNINNDSIILRIQRNLWYNAIPFLLFLLTFLTIIFTKSAFEYLPSTKVVYTLKYKYFLNLWNQPWLLVVFLTGVVLVLTGISMSLIKKSKKGILFAGSGVVITVLSLFLLAGLHNTSYYPSLTDIQSSLTIENSSSSRFTLITMSYVSLIVPFVFAYIYITWKAINKKQIDLEELSGESHKY